MANDGRDGDKGMGGVFASVAEGWYTVLRSGSLRAHTLTQLVRELVLCSVGVVLCFSMVALAACGPEPAASVVAMLPTLVGRLAPISRGGGDH